MLRSVDVSWGILQGGRGKVLRGLTVEAVQVGDAEDVGGAALGVAVCAGAD